LYDAATYRTKTMNPAVYRSRFIHAIYWFVMEETRTQLLLLVYMLVNSNIYFIFDLRNTSAFSWKNGFARIGESK